MALEVGDHIPETIEELEDAAAGYYKQGVDAGKAALRIAVKEFLNKEILAAKGNERRPDPADPQVRAIRFITERLYAAFEDGTL